tara:strand:+ start:1973 stop:2146 length:174 start_codon:yes stop_codon:yes gene_type:complete
MERERYKIIRYFRDDKPQRVIKEDLTLKEAQKHCHNPKNREEDASGLAIWFDGFTKE